MSRALTRQPSNSLLKSELHWQHHKAQSESKEFLAPNGCPRTGPKKGSWSHHQDISHAGKNGILQNKKVKIFSPRGRLPGRLLAGPVAALMFSFSTKTRWAVLRVGCGKTNRKPHGPFIVACSFVGQRDQGLFSFLFFPFAVLVSF